MNMFEFHDKFQEASYVAWKDPSYAYSMMEKMPNPRIYVKVNGKLLNVEDISSSNGTIIIEVSEDADANK